MSILKNSIAPKYGENTFIVGSENKGFWIYDADKETFAEMTLANVPYDTGNWKIHCLKEDNQGNIWTGAFQKGVMVIPKSMYGFEHMLNSCVTSLLMDEGERRTLDRHRRQRNLHC